MEDQKQQISCRICGTPVSLVADTVADENRQPVHSYCYVTHGLGNEARRDKAVLSSLRVGSYRYGYNNSGIRGIRDGLHQPLRFN